jgi:hypothetical protein
MTNNEKFHISLRGNVRFNNQDLNKLNTTDRLSLDKIMEYLKVYNEDIPYKSMMHYVDEPRILYNKLKEYYID